MKSYSAAPDVKDCVDYIRKEHHEELVDVHIATLFVFDTENSEPVLKHHGYSAQAVARIVPLRERALGMADACIVVDRSVWLALSMRQRYALMDHELTHLVRVKDEDTEQPLFDALDRPKLSMRTHDHQFGWFDDIAARHGDASPEIRQAKALIEATGQLYFDFERKAA